MHLKRCPRINIITCTQSTTTLSTKRKTPWQQDDMVQNSKETKLRDIFILTVSTLDVYGKMVIVYKCVLSKYYILMLRNLCFANRMFIWSSASSRLCVFVSPTTLCTKYTQTKVAVYIVISDFF